jgi:ABC-type transporter MlaC component
MYKDEFVKHLLNGADPEEMMTALKDAIEEVKAQERARAEKEKKRELARSIADAVTEYARLSVGKDIPNLTEEEMDTFGKAFEKEFTVLVSALSDVPAYKPMKARSDIDDADLILENWVKNFL